MLSCLPAGAWTRRCCCRAAGRSPARRRSRTLVRRRRPRAATASPCPRISPRSAPNGPFAEARLRRMWGRSRPNGWPSQGRSGRSRGRASRMHERLDLLAHPRFRLAPLSPTAFSSRRSRVCGCTESSRCQRTRRPSTGLVRRRATRAGGRAPLRLRARPTRTEPSWTASPICPWTAHARRPSW